MTTYIRISDYYLSSIIILWNHIHSYMLVYPRRLRNPSSVHTRPIETNVYLIHSRMLLLLWLYYRLLLKKSVYATSIWCSVGMRYHGICLFTHKLMKNRCLTIFASSCSYTCQINCDKWTYFSGLKINSASNRRSSYKKLILCVSMWSTEIILRDL